MKGNLILIHGGGPTAVINASLAGAIRQAKKEPNVDRILAAIGGTGGLMRGQVRDLTDITEEELALLERTPGSAIGTSRDALEEPEYRLLAEKCVELGAKYVLMNGGNGTMDACGKLCRMLAGTDIRVMGIPKTMDNDIAVTDHAPGFGSAARYIAQSVAEVTADVRGLPIHVVVIEASGRNAGWITAASALARQAGVDGPDLIYLPERPFDEAQYLRDVQKLIEEKHGVVVVASEGLKDKDGKPIVEPVFKVGRATYFGDVSAHLANLVIKHLGYKARSEKPGLLGRASIKGGKVKPSYRPRVKWTDLRACLPDFVAESMKAALPLLDRKLHGFADPDAVLTGVETRSSSPVRIERDANCLSELKGLYPCGEGAGYAGGILSAAVDGLRCADALLTGEKKG